MLKIESKFIFCVCVMQLKTPIELAIKQHYKQNNLVHYHEFCNIIGWSGHYIPWSIVTKSSKSVFWTKTKQ